MEFTKKEIQLIELALHRYDDNYYDKRTEIADLLSKIEEE
jgi:hypothetical protein